MSNYNIIFSDELYHHGIKGMKWGIRRFQNLDGSLTAEGRARYGDIVNNMIKKGGDREDLTKERTIPAGTKMYRTSVNPNESNDGFKYVSYAEADRNHYKGGWIKQTSGGKSTYEYEYSLTKDLKIPSRETQYKVVNDVLKKNKKLLHDSVKEYVNMLFPENSWSRMELEASFEDNGGKENMKTFTNDMVKRWSKNTPEELAFNVCQSLGTATNVKKAIAAELQKKGYNAMVDEASVGGQQGYAKEGVDPLILFDASMLKTNSVHGVSDKEERKAHKKDVKQQQKFRQNSGSW